MAVKQAWGFKHTDLKFTINVFSIPQYRKQTPLPEPRPDLRQRTDREVNETDREQLYDRIKELLPDCRFAKYDIPIQIPDGEEQCEYDCDDEITKYVKVHPPSLNGIRNVEDFSHSLILSEAEIEKIENDTRGQSESERWFEERHKRITASNFHSVYVRRSTTDPSALIKTLLGYNRASTKAMKFGLAKEAVARYMKYLSVKERCIEFKQSGFRVSTDFPFLGDSADGILETKTGKQLFEFKNPLSTWDMTLDDAVKNLPCLKIDENNQPMLNRKHAYYTQVQGQMGVYVIKVCDFVMCTTDDIFVERITFDKAFGNKLVAKLQAFYISTLLPELVYLSLKYGNDVLVLKS